MPASFAINPQTQKKIKVGGPTWKAIEAKGGKLAEEMKASVGVKAPSKGRVKKSKVPKPKLVKPRSPTKSPSPTKPLSPAQADDDIFMGIISKTPKTPRTYFTPPSSPTKSSVKPKSPSKSYKSVFTTPKPSGGKTIFNPLTVFQSTKNSKTNYWLIEGSFEDCSSIRVIEFTENNHENAAIRVLEHLYRDTSESKRTGNRLDSVGDLTKKFFSSFSSPKISWKGSAEATLGILNEDWLAQMEKGGAANIFGDSDWGTKWLASFMRPFVFAGKQHLVIIDTPETRPLMEIVYSETYKPAPKVTLVTKKAKPVSPQSPAKGMWADWTRGWKDLYF